MFGSSIKLDKALLARVKRMSDLAGLLLGERVHHPRAGEGARAARDRRHGRGDQEAAEGARLHLVRPDVIVLNRALTGCSTRSGRRSTGCPRWPAWPCCRSSRRSPSSWRSSGPPTSRRCVAAKRAMQAAIFEMRLFNDDLVAAVSRAGRRVAPHAPTICGSRSRRRCG